LFRNCYFYTLRCNCIFLFPYTQNSGLKHAAERVRTDQNRFQTEQREKERMGAISDKLEGEIHKIVALTSQKTIITVPGNGLISMPHGGPLAGQAMALSTSVDMQIAAIVACIRSLAVAIKELEDHR
jgi:hypothetical protein